MTISQLLCMILHTNYIEEKDVHHSGH